jgi:hypothetical protein
VDVLVAGAAMLAKGLRAEFDRRAAEIVGLGAI